MDGNERVVIYDRGGSSIRGLEARERLAACYRWASARGKVVLDQVLAWDPAGPVISPTLSGALDACARGHADLLAYADECVGDEVARAVVGERLGSLKLLSVIDSGAYLCGAPRV